jgi:hypothetical protein
MMKAKEIKMKLAFWTIIDQLVTEIAKNGDGVEKKLMDSLVKLIHEENKNTEVNK